MKRKIQQRSDAVIISLIKHYGYVLNYIVVALLFICGAFFRQNWFKICANFSHHFFTSHFVFALDLVYSYFLHLFHFFSSAVFLCLCLLKTNATFWKSVIVMEKVAVLRWLTAEHKISKTRCVWAFKKNGYLKIIQVQKWNKRPKWMLFCVCRTRTRAHANLCTIKALNFQVWFSVVNSQTRNQQTASNNIVGKQLRIGQYVACVIQHSKHRTLLFR